MTDNFLQQWTRLGILFNIKPTPTTPDIELLLVETARQLRGFPRLLPACVTWLGQYDRLVCRHRLAGSAAAVTDTETSAALGLLLSFTKELSGTDHFNLAIKQCRPYKEPRPLFAVDRKSERLALLSKQNSTSLSRTWGLWCESVQLKEDAIRPLAWVMRHNPSLQQRALFGGNLRASILEILARDNQAGQSESLLARHCYATRKAVREALEHLEFCQLIRRRAAGRKTIVSIV